MDPDLQNDLLARGLDDLLQLVEIISVVGGHVGIDRHDQSVMDPTLKVIYCLLSSGYAIAGSVEKDDKGILRIRSWGLSPSDTVSRIEEKWRELEKPPNLGDVVWLELTDRGRAEALKVSS
jgi:hypothetical protein